MSTRREDITTRALPLPPLPVFRDPGLLAATTGRSISESCINYSIRFSFSLLFRLRLRRMRIGRTGVLTDTSELFQCISSNSADVFVRAPVRSKRIHRHRGLSLRFVERVLARASQLCAADMRTRLTPFTSERNGPQPRRWLSYYEKNRALLSAPRQGTTSIRFQFHPGGNNFQRRGTGSSSP